MQLVYSFFRFKVSVFSFQEGVDHLIGFDGFVAFVDVAIHVQRRESAGAHWGFDRNGKFFFLLSLSSKVQQETCTGMPQRNMKHSVWRRERLRVALNFGSIFRDVDQKCKYSIALEPRSLADDMMRDDLYDPTSS